MNPVDYYCQAMDARKGLFCCLEKHLHADRPHTTRDGEVFEAEIPHPVKYKDISKSHLSFRFDGRR